MSDSAAPVTFNLILIDGDSSETHSRAVIRAGHNKPKTSHYYHTTQKATIHQVIIMLTTSKTILFLGHNHLLSTGTDGVQTIVYVSGHQYHWLAGGYDL